MEYNEMPEAAVKLTDKSRLSMLYGEMQDFFTYCTTEVESRQVFKEKGNIRSKMIKLKIFWINKDKGLGYGIAQDWYEKKIEIYRFGSNENWRLFRNGFAAAMSGDNS